jgi:hypothetical protein
MRAIDQFHAGVVTDDFDATLNELTAVFGYEWSAEVATSIPVLLPEGDAVVELRLVYSRATPRVEIVQSIPGTVWQPAAGSGIHHLGYWSDGVRADCDELQERGYMFEAAGKGQDGTPVWAYLGREGSPRIELVSRALQPGLEMLWASTRGTS